jgi:hypothetical protein
MTQLFLAVLLAWPSLAAPLLQALDDIEIGQGGPL